MGGETRDFRSPAVHETVLCNEDLPHVPGNLLTLSPLIYAMTLQIFLVSPSDKLNEEAPLSLIALNSLSLELIILFQRIQIVSLFQFLWLHITTGHVKTLSRGLHYSLKDDSPRKVVRNHFGHQ